MEEISQVSKWFKYSLKASKQLLWYFLLAGQFSNDHWNIQSTWLLKVHIRDIKKKTRWLNETGMNEHHRQSRKWRGPKFGIESRSGVRTQETPTRESRGRLRRRRERRRFPCTTGTPVWLRTDDCVLTTLCTAHLSHRGTDRRRDGPNIV